MADISSKFDALLLKNIQEKYNITLEEAEIQSNRILTTTQKIEHIVLVATFTLSIIYILFILHQFIIDQTLLFFLLLFIFGGWFLIVILFFSLRALVRLTSSRILNYCFISFRFLNELKRTRKIIDAELENETQEKFKKNLKVYFSNMRKIYSVGEKMSKLLEESKSSVYIKESSLGISADQLSSIILHNIDFIDESRNIETYDFKVFTEQFRKDREYALITHSLLAFVKHDSIYELYLKLEHLQKLIPHYKEDNEKFSLLTSQYTKTYEELAQNPKFRTDNYYAEIISEKNILS